MQSLFCLRLCTLGPPYVNNLALTHLAHFKLEKRVRNIMTYDGKNNMGSTDPICCDSIIIC